MDHCFPPIIDQQSEILILGSLPGPQSLRAGQYYAHPQNKFWRLIFSVFSAPLLVDYQARCEFLLQRHIALWDVLQSADREGALDNNIRNAVANNFPDFFAHYPQLKRIIFNGRTAEKYFRQNYADIFRQMDHACVLSSSPACARADGIKEQNWRQALKL